jgi:hypothetical protein
MCERLRPTLGIDNGETAVTEPATIQGQNAAPVRAAVGQPIEQDVCPPAVTRCPRRGTERIQDRKNAAHRSSSPACALGDPCGSHKKKAPAAAGALSFSREFVELRSHATPSAPARIGIGVSIDLDGKHDRA